jgi:hypothetical protein
MENQKHNPIKGMVSFLNESCIMLDMYVPKPATEERISAISQEFKERIGHDLPEEYKMVLRESNGVFDSGLVMWPTDLYWEFTDTIVSANKKLRERFSQEYLYFGFHEDRLFVKHVQTGECLCISIDGKKVLNKYEDMLDLMVYTIHSATSA